MTALALENINEYCEPSLPPECLLDPYNPANDRYYKAKADLERRIVHASAIMKPKQVMAVKKQFSGMTNVDIAAAISVTSSTVGKYLKDPKAQRLRSLLAHYQSHIDGPNEAHRKSFLYRIAVDNEHDKPTVSISAITEMNRMAGTYDKKGGGSGGTSITVVVQHQVLERGALDG